MQQEKSQSVDKKTIQRRLEGVVVGDRNDKTVSVKVITVKRHPMYRIKYQVSKKYKAHDETNKYHVGDKIIIQACRPISRDKRWRVIGLVQ